MRNMMTPKAQAEAEEIWRLRREAVTLLRHVVAEWKSDPMSVQCFDERLVKRSTEVCERLKKLDIFDETI